MTQKRSLWFNNMVYISADYIYILLPCAVYKNNIHLKEGDAQKSEIMNLLESAS